MNYMLYDILTVAVLLTYIHDQVKDVLTRAEFGISRLHLGKYYPSATTRFGVTAYV